MLRVIKDRITTFLIFLSGFAVVFLFLVLFSFLLYRAYSIFHLYPLNLIFGAEWQPGAGKFGFFPFLFGSVVVTITAMVIAVPVSLLSAIYLAEYIQKRHAQTFKVFVDLMGSIPSVVYGVFGVIVIIPFVRSLASFLGVQSTGYSVLAGGLVLAMMVSPTIISVAEEVIRSIPMSFREVALSLGATQWETIRFVTLKVAKRGVFGAVVFGFARAFGETMAVMMVVGNVPQIPRSPFDPAYPLPALIANSYGEMMSIPLYDSALMFAALILFISSLLCIFTAKFFLRLS